MTDKKSKTFENYPIILVASDIMLQEKYVKDYIIENSILPYFIFRVQPVKEEISIEQIRLIKKEIVSSTIEKRLFILYSFDYASGEAQNAFLKTLEEVKNNRFILLVKNIHRVLPTIRSRCQTIILDNVSKINKISTQDEFINQIIRAKDYSFLGSKQVMDVTKDQAIIMIEEIINYSQKELIRGKQQSTKILKAALKQRELLLNNNLNSQLTIDNLLIFIYKTSKMK